MSRNKLKTRQRTFLTHRMKLVAGAAVSLLTVVVLIIYFNFYDIKDTRAFSTGDYRTIASGNWDDVAVWEVFDGSSWNPAMEPPGDGVRNILVTNNQSMIVTDEIPINHLIIDEGSKVSIESNTIKISKFNNQGGLTCHGTLELGSSILEGNGDFLIGPKAILMIGSDAGIDRKAATGNVQMSGKKEYHKDATYIFNGSVLQHTGNALPTVLKNLVIDNSSGVILDQHAQVLTSLKLKNGVLYTGKHSLMIGNSVQNTCEIDSDHGALSGNIKMWYGPQNINQLSFMLSDGFLRSKIKLTTDQPAMQKGLVDIVYKEGIPDDSQKSPFEAGQVVVAITNHGYFSAKLSNGSEDGWLQLKGMNVVAPELMEVVWDINQKPGQGTANTPASNKTAGNVPKIKSISNVLYGPNPFKNQLVVRFYSDFKTTASMQMMNEKGKVVQIEKLEVAPGYNQFVFDGNEKLVTGSYMVQISNPSEIHTFKVMCDDSQGPLTGSR